MKDYWLHKLEEIIKEKIITPFHSSSGTRMIQTETENQYFLKYGAPSLAYPCEANGLRELAKAKCIHVAEVISVGEDYLLTRYINQGTAGKNFFADFGKRLARMHQYQAITYGFREDNFIGANPQLNKPSDTEKNNWTVFYFNKRLLYQFKLAETNGYATHRLTHGFSQLEKKIEQILQGSEELPSLLHGDLWSGNFLCNQAGEPVLIDPAVYYGHREADLAMTKLFGGFSPDFYQAYQQEYPLPEGWEYRENIYKLYHVLNHLNLFGTGYLHEAEWIVESYI